MNAPKRKQPTPESLRHFRSLAPSAGKHQPYPFAGGFSYLDVDESKMMRARTLGRYEPNKMNLIRNCLPPGGIFIDVDSNKGDFTLLAAKTVGSNGRVFSFEPEPRNCCWIGKSIEADRYDKMKLFELALSGTDGTALLHLGTKSAWHTLVPQCPARGAGVIEVVTKRLDSVLKEADQASVDMIKIDVEGAELEVLKGARETLSNNNDLVLTMDLHPHLGVEVAEIFKILQEQDLQVYEAQAPFNIPARAHSQLCEILAYRG